MSDIFEKLQSFNKIKAQQVFCPTSKIRVIVTPMTVGDDLSLKTMIVSPDVYDYQLAKLLYEHSEFPDITKSKPTFEEFVETFSDFDKKALLWGLIASTYSNLGKQEISCVKCKHKFEDTIFADDLIHEDFATFWDKQEPFNKYFYTIDIDVNDKSSDFKSISFVTSIPSIKQHFDILQLVSPESMKENYDKFGFILSKSEELSLITRQINIANFKNEITNIDKFFDVHRAVKEYIPLNIVKNVVEKYNDHFVKYEPKFRKEYICSNCSHKFDFIVDTEMALFRNFLGI